MNYKLGEVASTEEKNMAGKNQIEEYNYHLPEEKIAKFPLEKREQSRLLVCKSGSIKECRFKNILNFLPGDSLLLFNDTKVIAARLIFYKKTGARIEVFLLEPVLPYRDLTRAMEARNECVWKCTIGNKKKWKNGAILKKKMAISGVEVTLEAAWEDATSDLIRLQWNKPFSFAEVIQHAGHTPIPPYLGRADEKIDESRYQTVYSRYEGAVAAPTAGLHFTDSIIGSLDHKNIMHDFVTLHVSAGTFKPVQSENYLEHDMHREQVIVAKATLANLLEAKQVICVGTTSLRTLESLYWMGVKRIFNLPDFTFVEKLFPYSIPKEKLPSKEAALSALLHYAEENDLENFTGETGIFIFPGYPFQLCNGLVTNFHLPKSTLLLLIAAFIGEDWKKVYNTALNNGFRFLSYGDSSLLIP